VNNTNYRQIIDLIKYPIITDKATRLLELNQYTFATDLRANKDQIKSAIEYLFKVKELYSQAVQLICSLKIKNIISYTELTNLLSYGNTHL